MRILVIERFLPIREGYVTLLEKARYDVDSVAEIAEGLEIISERKPDAILCHLCYPGCEGLTLLEHESVDDVPVIYLSAGAREESFEGEYLRSNHRAFGLCDKGDPQQALSCLQRVALRQEMSLS